MAKPVFLDVKDLLALTSSDLDTVKKLGPPRDSNLADASSEELTKVGVRFRGFSKFLVEADQWKLDTADGRPVFDHGDISDFWKLLQVSTGYSMFALYKAVTDSQYALNLGDFIGENEIDFPEEALDPEVFAELDQACRLLYVNDTLALMLLNAAAVDGHGFQTGETSEKFDSDLMFVSAMQNFVMTGNPDLGPAKVLFDQMLRDALEFRGEVLKRRYKARRQEADKSLAGLLGREFELLSSRNAIMTEKYGEKRVERIFEQKLALLFQSLGFTVIPARPGEAAADLLCIARAEKFSFLIDAKSTKRAYALPKADQRALEEYAKDFGSRLPDLPSLEFLLIAGNDAAGTVPGKLESLERAIGLPVRFIPASVLSEFRRELPGPVPPSVFKDALLVSDPVVNNSLTESAKRALDGVGSAYLHFMRGIRDSSQVK